MHRTTRDRRGFTLVELLVVIAIIGVLMALLLPAVNAAREAGRRTVCTNNQFQMAFAMVRYDAAKRSIPGWRNWVSGSTTSFSWPVVILPNMERKDVYNAITSGSVPSTYISFFVCPSNPPDALTSPLLAYEGSVGVGSNAIGARATGVMLDVTATGAMSARVSMDDVAGNDGTATTVMLASASGTAVGNTMSWNVNWSGAGSGLTSGVAPAPPAFGIVGTAPAKVINSGVLGNATTAGASNMPTSNHPGGVVAAFCDGHTAFLKDTLPARVYAQLLSWNHAAASGAAPYSTWTSGYPVLQEADYQ